MALRVSTSTGTPLYSMRGVPSKDIVVRDTPSSPCGSATTILCRRYHSFVTLSACWHAQAWPPLVGISGSRVQTNPRFASMPQRIALEEIVRGGSPSGTGDASSAWREGARHDDLAPLLEG